MSPRPLYACVAVREFPAQAMLRLRKELRSMPCAILDGAPPLETICARNAAARRIGIMEGMTRVEAETFPAKLFVRSRDAEQNARAAILACAARFTPRVEECPRDSTWLTVLDIAGTGRLFGPPEKLAAVLIGQLYSIGVAASIVVASNFTAARCLALARAVGCTVITTGQEQAALAPLPLTVLDLAGEQAITLAGWGIRTLGELAALPEASLAARLGQQALRQQAIARGVADHLFVPLDEEFGIAESMDLDTPVEVLDSLLFVLRVLLEQMLRRAADHLVAVAGIALTLRLEGGASHTRTVRPALPGNDLQLWMKLLQLELATHPPSSAIHAVKLTAELGSHRRAQMGLFAPQTPEPDRLDITLARLRALVGEGCVGTPVLKDTHKPDSFEMTAFSVKTAEQKTGCGIQPPSPRSALRTLRPPEDLQVTLRHRRPVSLVFRGVRYAIDRAYGPWIASGEWWSANLWASQQWDVIARGGNGDPLYGCLVWETLTKRWQMVCLYD